MVQVSEEDVMFQTIVVICSVMGGGECLKSVDTLGPYKTKAECVQRGKFIAEGSIPALEERDIAPPWQVTVECVKTKGA